MTLECVYQTAVWQRLTLMTVLFWFSVAWGRGYTDSKVISQTIFQVFQNKESKLKMYFKFIRENRYKLRIGSSIDNIKYL
jgi:hypothetical protein